MEHFDVLEKNTKQLITFVPKSLTIFAHFPRKYAEIHSKISKNQIITLIIRYRSESFDEVGSQFDKSPLREFKSQLVVAVTRCSLAGCY